MIKLLIQCILFLMNNRCFPPPTVTTLDGVQSK